MGDENQFYDEMHLTKWNVDKLTNIQINVVTDFPKNRWRKYSASVKVSILKNT